MAETFKSFDLSSEQSHVFGSNKKFMIWDFFIGNILTLYLGMLLTVFSHIPPYPWWQLLELIMI